MGKEGESEEIIKKHGKHWKRGENVEQPGKTGRNKEKHSLNFIRLLRVVITPSVTSESTGR